MGNGVGAAIRVTGTTAGDETVTAIVAGTGAGETAEGVRTAGAATTGFTGRVGDGKAVGADARIGAGFGTTLELRAVHVLGSTTTNRSPFVFKR